MKQKCIEREMTMEIVVGAFVVMVFLGLGYFTIILSRDQWFGRKQSIEVVFPSVMGLRKTDNAVVRGMPVGAVKDLRIEEDGVHVVADLDEDLVLREGYKIVIETTSILGGRHMAIDTGPPDGTALPRDSVFRGEAPRDLMLDASEAVYAMKKGLVEGGVIENVQATAMELKSIASRLNSGKGTLGKLLSEDDQVYKDLAASVASLRAIAGRLESGEGTLGKLLSEDDVVYRDLASTVESLKSIVASVERGEGMLGRLVKDDSLYDQLMKAIEELRGWIDDSRETSPVVNFTSIFFGAF